MEIMNENFQRVDFLAFDTFCSIQVYDCDGYVTAEVLEAAQSLTQQVEHTLSMYQDNSELTQLCRTYLPDIPVAVSDVLFRFISENLKFSQNTNGVVDMTIGSLVKLWDFLAEHPHIPQEREIKKRLRQTGFRHIKTNEALHTVTIDIPGIQLDPGASGKGFALAEVSAFLKSQRVQRAVLNFGGNIYAIGGKPVITKRKEHAIEMPWTVALRNPIQRNTILGKVELFQRGIATSSWYEHSFQKNGTVFHHLLDIQTGYPKQSDISSVSILSSNALYTDLVSTAFFLLGLKEGQKLVARLESQGVDIDYVAVHIDGTVYHSEGISFLPS